MTTDEILNVLTTAALRQVPVHITWHPACEDAWGDNLCWDNTTGVPRRDTDGRWCLRDGDGAGSWWFTLGEYDERRSHGPVIIAASFASIPPVESSEWTEQVTRAQRITVASTRDNAHDIHWTSVHPDVLTICGMTITISSVRRMLAEIEGVK